MRMQVCLFFFVAVAGIFGPQGGEQPGRKPQQGAGACRGGGGNGRLFFPRALWGSEAEGPDVLFPFRVALAPRLGGIGGRFGGLPFRSAIAQVFQRAIASCRRVLGEQHPLAMQMQSNLAVAR